MRLAFGLLLSVLTLWNLEIGFYQMGTGEMRKLVLTMVASGVCGEAAITADLAAVGQSACLQPLGTWEPIDAILLMLGVRLTWTSLRDLFGSGSKVNRDVARGKRLQKFAMLLTLVGLADLFGMLSENGEPLDASELFGFPLTGGVALIILSTALILSLVGGSMVRKGGKSGAGRDRPSSRRFLGPAERHLGGEFSVGELRRALMLDAFEDPFMVGIDDDMGDNVGRTCHYCNGEGCTTCGFSGTLD